MKIPGPLIRGRFLERPNRFRTIVELEAGTVEAHLPDPGRLEELLSPGRRVWVRPARTRGRRTSYTLALVESPTGELVSVVTTLPNELVAEALHDRRLLELAGWEVSAHEHRWGTSRFDFLLVHTDGGRMLLEVKSVTLLERGHALFPDAVTSRGARHVRELTAAQRAAGLEAAVVFVVQRRDAESVRAARVIDPVFADALVEAERAGVRLLGYRCVVTLEEARITEPLPVVVG